MPHLGVVKANFQLILLMFHSFLSRRSCGVRIRVFTRLNSPPFLEHLHHPEILIDNFHFMDQLDDGSQESIEPIDLHGLLSQDPIRSWGPIYKRIQGNPHEVQERYYRNESCFQLALKATEQCDSSPSIPLGTGGCCKHVVSRIDVLQAIVDADPSAIHWRDDEG